MAYSERVLAGEERCLPAWTMRRSAGEARLVRRARRERSVLIEVLAGIVRGIAVGTQLALFANNVGAWKVVPKLGTMEMEHTVTAGDGFDEDLHRFF